MRPGYVSSPEQRSRMILSYIEVVFLLRHSSVPPFSCKLLFLFMAIQLRIAAFRSSFPPTNLCLAQAPALQALVPIMWVAGSAYGLLNLEVTRSSRSRLFFLWVGSSSSPSMLSSSLGRLSDFHGSDWLARPIRRPS